MRNSYSLKVIWTIILGLGVLVSMAAGIIAIWSFATGGPEQVAQTFKIIVTATDSGLGTAVEELRALIKELREVVAIARELLESER